MNTVTCEACDFTWETDNEDEMVFALCPICGEYGVDGYTDLGIDSSEFCNCEDYPCCGH